MKTLLEFQLMSLETRSKLEALAPERRAALDFDLWTTILTAPKRVRALSEDWSTGRRMRRFEIDLLYGRVALGVCDGLDWFVLLDFAVGPAAQEVWDWGQ